MYNKIKMQKYTFKKSRRFRIVAISDCPIPTYKLELEFSFAQEPDQDPKSWLNELLIYCDNFPKCLGMLCTYLDINALEFEFFNDEMGWTYFED